MRRCPPPAVLGKIPLHSNDQAPPWSATAQQEPSMNVRVGDEIPPWVMPNVRPERMRAMAPRQRHDHSARLKLVSRHACFQGRSDSFGGRGVRFNKINSLYWLGRFRNSGLSDQAASSGSTRRPLGLRQSGSRWGGRRIIRNRSRRHPIGPRTYGQARSGRRPHPSGR